jgi:hypothetical protein
MAVLQRMEAQPPMDLQARVLYACAMHPEFRSHVSPLYKSILSSSSSSSWTLRGCQNALRAWGHLHLDTMVDVRSRRNIIYIYTRVRGSCRLDVEFDILSIFAKK